MVSAACVVQRVLASVPFCGPFPNPTSSCFAAQPALASQLLHSCPVGAPQELRPGLRCSFLSSVPHGLAANSALKSSRKPERMPAPPCLAVNPSCCLQHTRERGWGSPSPSRFPGLSSSLGEHLPTHGVQLAPTFEANPVNPKSTNPRASQLKLLQISIKTFQKECTLSKKSVPRSQVSILSFNSPLAGIPSAKSQSEGFKGTWGCTRAPFSLVVGKLLYLSKPLCVPLTGRHLGELSPRCSPQGGGPPTPVSVNGSVTAVITLSSAVPSAGHLGGRIDQIFSALGRRVLIYCEKTK